MNLLIAILVGLIVIGVVLWAIQKILGVVAVPEPFKTIIWVVVVLIAVLLFVQITGLYNFGAVQLNR